MLNTVEQQTRREAGDRGTRAHGQAAGDHRWAFVRDGLAADHGVGFGDAESDLGFGRGGGHSGAREDEQRSEWNGSRDRNEGSQKESGMIWPRWPPGLVHELLD